MKIVKLSSIYETEPLLFENQNSFLNMVLEVDYKGSPDQLLELKALTLLRHYQKKSPKKFIKNIIPKVM